MSINLQVSRFEEWNCKVPASEYPVTKLGLLLSCPSAWDTHINTSATARGSNSESSYNTCMGLFESLFCTTLEGPCQSRPGDFCANGRPASACDLEIILQGTSTGSHKWIQHAIGTVSSLSQVYRHCQGGYWRASKRWCKQLPLDAVSKALIRFANNEAGLCPACVYGGPAGAIEQLKCLERWFLVLSSFTDSWPKNVSKDCPDSKNCSGKRKTEDPPNWRVLQR